MPPHIVINCRKNCRKAGLRTLSETLPSDPVLAHFRATLNRLCGGRLNGWCCSARARVEKHLDSDYDVAVFLRNLTGGWREIDRLAAIETDIDPRQGAARPGHRSSQAHPSGRPARRQAGHIEVDELRRS
jgi:hypothetical protein